MPIYVVIGVTGEYDTKAEWPVCWTADIRQARSIVERLNEEADFQYRQTQRAWERKDYDEHHRLNNEALFDPMYQAMYPGVQYTYYEVESHQGTLSRLDQAAEHRQEELAKMDDAEIIKFRSDE